MKTLIYIHGFNSARDYESAKVKEFLNLADDVKLLEYDTFAPRDEIIAKLSKDLESVGDDVVLVGTSLGGYYASALARRFELKAILLNPATNPYKDLSEAVGVSLKNYVTGETKVLTKSVLDSYRDLPIFAKREDYAFSPTVLVCLDDDVINPKETLEMLSDLDPIMFLKGGHGFAFDDDKRGFFDIILNN